MKQRVMRVVAGLILLAIAVVGLRHGARAETAQILYFQSKFGAWKDDPDRILAAAERAHASYPRNYLLCALAADTAYHHRFDAAGAERADRLSAAARWARTGLALNPHFGPLVYLDVCLAARRSPAEAARQWEAYVDWSFWDVYNQAVLVELYSRAGRYAEAVRALRWLQGSPYEPRARAVVTDAWNDEIADLSARQRPGRLPRAE